MTRPKRFRGMELTAIEVSHAHALYVVATASKVRRSSGIFIARSSILLARAKRLLPLWRKWGLEELAANSYLEGKVS